MGLKLNEKKTTTILFKDMEQGDIGVIVDNSDYSGLIVMRLWEDMVVSLTCGDNWSKLENNTLEVQLLEEGTLLEVQGKVPTA